MKNSPVLYRVAAGLALALLASAAPVNAAPVTIASDTFETTDHPTGDRTLPANNALAFYTRVSSGTAAIGPDATFNSKGLAINDTDASATTSMPIIAPLPSTVNIANIGDSVTLSFTFRYTNNGANVSSTNTSVGTNTFRFGLFTSNATSAAADLSANPGSDDDKGYYAAFGSGSATPPAANAILYQESGDSSPLTNILGGLDRTNLTLSGNTGTAINDNNTHTASLTISRTSATAVGFSLVVDANPALTGSDTSGINTSFDEIAFGGGFGNIGNAYVLDNVTVSAKLVPEPATLALLSLAVPALLARRRKTVA